MALTASFELEEDAILIRAQEEFQIEQMEDILRDKLVRRKVDTGCLDPRGIEGSGNEKRRRYKIVQGIDRDQGKEIVKRVKESKLKVQASVQGEKIRITGKKRDDLQACDRDVARSQASGIPATVRKLPRLTGP